MSFRMIEIKDEVPRRYSLLLSLAIVVRLVCDKES